METLKKLKVIVVLTIIFHFCYHNFSFSQTPQSYTIDGYFTYDNVQHTPLDSVIVYLVYTGTILDSVQTDSSGYYIFHNVQNGIYNIIAKTNKPWENVNFTDYMKVKFQFVGFEYLTSSIRLHSADVNLSGAINTSDAVKIGRRIFGLENSFNRGNWVFEKPFGGDTIFVSSGLNDTVIVNGSNTTQNFMGRCVGDVNYNTCSGSAGITKVDTVQGCSPGIIVVPLHINNLPPLCAITLMLEYDGSVLSFISSSFLGSVQFSNGSTLKKLILGNGFSENAPYSNNSVLIYLNFTYYGGTTSIVFNNSVMGGIMCEYADANDNPLCDTPTSSYYINGAVIQSTVPTPPASIVLNSIVKCSGLTDTLGIIGGCLGDATNWFWYSGSCGGTPVGSGVSVIVFPTITTEYFVRAEGLVHTSSCDSISVTADTYSVTPDSATASPDNVCASDSTTLGISGGSAGTGASWKWYIGSCGGTYVISGVSPVLSPTVSTVYFVRAENNCNTTACSSITITLDSGSVAANTINSATTIYSGVLTTLSETGGFLGTNANWFWYTGICGGTLLGTGQTIGISPTLNTVYYLRAEGLCNTTVCVSEQIYILPSYTVSGTVKYDQSQYPLDSVWLFINSNGNIIDSTRSDTNGLYMFNAVPPGVFTLTAKTHKPWGGVNTTDGTKIEKHIFGTELFTTSLRLHSGDVNNSMFINVTDVVKIMYRFVGTDTSFARGDWDFEKSLGGDTINVSPTLNDTIIVNGNNLVQDFKGICVGDVNGSNIPSYGAKSQAKLQLNNNEKMKLNAGQYFEMPVKVTNDITVGAISLILNYPKELVQIVDVQFSTNNDQLPSNDEEENLVYHASGNELRIGWSEEDEGLNFKNNEPLIIIRGKTTDKFKPGDEIYFKLKNDGLCELADENGNPFENVTLNACSIENINTSDIGTMPDEMTNDMILYPNPARDVIKIQYYLSREAIVKISLYNVIGEKVIDIVNQQATKGTYNSVFNLFSIPSGVYTCKMLLDDKSVFVKKFIISK